MDYDEPDPENRERAYYEDEGSSSSDYQSVIDGILDDLNDGSVVTKS
jgi:hypothetical protein